MSEGKSPADLVKGPGIGLLVVGILGAGFGVLGLLNSIFGFGIGAAQLQEMQQQGQQVPEWSKFFVGGGVLQIFTGLLGIALSGFVAYAGMQMQKLQGATICMVGSIVAMLPCYSCCCIGLPIGIWALIVLNKPEVKAAFGRPPMG